MNLFLNPFFWISIFLSGIFLKAIVDIKLRLVLTSLINLLLLGFFIGKMAVVFLITLSVFLFINLGYLKKLPKLRYVILFGLIVPFVLYKLDGVHKNTPVAFQWFYLLPFSYVFLRAIDAYNHLKTKKSNLTVQNFTHLLVYLMPINMYSAGPIASYKKSFDSFLESDVYQDFKGVLATVNIIATGFFYKFFCAEFLKNVYFGQAPIVSNSLLDTIIIFVYTFFDFAGYTNIAIGAGRIIGIHTPINFNAPFASSSVSEFYNRWHISLGEWIKRNIYFPMQMNFVRRYQFSDRGLLLFNAFVLICSFIFVGAWHGFAMRFIFWGFSLGLIIALEKIVIDFLKIRGWDKNVMLGHFWRVIGPVYNIIAISIVIHPAMNLMLGIK